MHIFITGASGYIGSAVAQRLIAQGHSVTGLARSAEAADRVVSWGMKAHLGDLADQNSIADILPRVDGVIHVAVGLPRGVTEADFTFVDLLIDGLAGTGKPLIMTSGLGVYAGIAETYVDEATPLSPAIPIQALRVQLEQRLLAASARGIRTVVLRPAHVYGGGSAGTLIRTQIAAARQSGSSAFIGEGTTPVSVLHIDDLAQAYLLALEHGKAGAIYNLVSETLSTREVAQAIGYAVGANGPAHAITMDEAQQVWGPLAMLYGSAPLVSSLRAVNDLGWQVAAPSLLFELTHGSLRSAFPATVDQ